MMRSRRSRSSRRLSRGQAAVEVALFAPTLLLMSMGTYDMGRFAADSSIAANQAREGLRTAVAGATSDVGRAIRVEAGPTVYADTSAVWGVAALGQVDDCIFGQSLPTPLHSCGDPNGCATNSPFWTTLTPIACFAVTTCPAATTCSPADYALPWGGSRIATVPPSWVVVRVVLKFTPVTPALNAFMSGGHLYSPRTLIGVAGY